METTTKFYEREIDLKRAQEVYQLSIDEPIERVLERIRMESMHSKYPENLIAFANVIEERLKRSLLQTI